MQANLVNRSSEIRNVNATATSTPHGKAPKGLEMISNMTHQQFIQDPPGEMNLRAHTLAPTTIPDLPSPVNTSPHNESNTKFSAVSAQSGVTVRDAPSFPYLAAMINKAAGHTQKKVVFDRSDYDDLLGQIID